MTDRPTDPTESERAENLAMSMFSDAVVRIAKQLHWRQPIEELHGQAWDALAITDRVLYLVAAEQILEDSGLLATIASLEAELADANNGKRLFRAEWQAAETQRDRYREALERIAHPEGPDDLDQVQTIALAALREDP